MMSSPCAPTGPALAQTAGDSDALQAGQAQQATRYIKTYVRSAAFGFTAIGLGRGIAEKAAKKPTFQNCNVAVMTL
jgi:hypothetical protein